MPSARDRRRMHLEQPHDHIAYALHARILIVGQTRRVSTPSLPNGGTIEWTAHVEQFNGAGVKCLLEFIPEQEATNYVVNPDVIDPFWRPGQDDLRDGRLITKGESSYTIPNAHERPIPGGKESFAARTEPPGIHSFLAYVVARAPIPGAGELPPDGTAAAVLAATPPLEPTRKPAPAIHPGIHRRVPQPPTYLPAKAAT